MRFHSCGAALFKLKKLIQFGWIFAMNTFLPSVTDVVSLGTMVMSALLGVVALMQLSLIGINMAHGSELCQHAHTSPEGVMRKLMMMTALMLIHSSQTLNLSRRWPAMAIRRREWPSTSLHIIWPFLP